jgi:hypothetical protein
MKTGIKHDQHKRRWDLVPFEALDQIVDVMTFGAHKYEDNNWKLLDQLEDRCFAAAMRHLSAFKQGELFDPETGISHIAHACTNLIFILWKLNKK